MYFSEFANCYIWALQRIYKPNLFHWQCSPFFTANSLNMKFSSIAAIVSLIATAMSAQGIEIGAPADGTQVKADHKFKVEVIEPVRLCILSSFHSLTSIDIGLH